MLAQSAILVVGPPRSGTSAVCHVLSECGVHFGDPEDFVDPAANAHNPIFFELLELNELNERVISRLGWNYADFSALPLREDFSSALVDEFEAAVVQLLGKFRDAPLFGLKDPRFCFTLPLWTTVLARVGIGVRLLRTRRNLAAVAASNARLNLDRGIDHGWRVATISDAAAGYFLLEAGHRTVWFEDLRRANAQALEPLAAVSSTTCSAVSDACDRVFREDLVHWREPSASEGAVVPTETDYEQLAQLMRAFRVSPLGRDTVAFGSGQRLAQQGLLEAGSVPFTQGPVQVYYRRENELFAEERSVIVPWPGRGWEQTVTIEFPEAACEYFRVDVNTSPGAYLIDALAIDRVEVAPLSAFVAANGAAYELDDGSIGLVSNHEDPWMYFRSPEGAASMLSVRILRMTPDEAGRRLFQSRRTEALVSGLQEKVSSSVDLAIGHVSHLRSAMEESTSRFEARATDMDVNVARYFAELGKHIAELRTLQTDRDAEVSSMLRSMSEQQELAARDRTHHRQQLAESHSHLVARASGIERALADLQALEMMGWWQKWKLKRGAR